VTESDKEEIYREIKRDLLRDYYSGHISNEEYESKLEELEERKSGGSGGGGFSIFPKRSIWDDLDLPPEQFDFYAPATEIGMAFVLFFASYVVYLFRDNPGWTAYGHPAWGVYAVIATMDGFGACLIIVAVFWLRHWRRKKRSGEYALHQERYWETHQPPPLP
jgi:hypothetical protein